MIDPKGEPRSSQFRYVIASAAREEQSDALRSICILLHGKIFVREESQVSFLKSKTRCSQSDSEHLSK